MIVLAFYTATDPGSVALRTRERTSTRELPRGRQFELLVPAAEELLLERDIPAHELDGIAIARGPGSFTGLRVAAAAALGIAHGTGAPLYAVATLEVWAAAALADPNGRIYPRHPGICRVVLDARRDEVYRADFAAGGDALQTIRGPDVVPLADAGCGLTEQDLLIGDARELVLSSSVRRGAPLSCAGFSVPRQALAAELARLVAHDPAHYVCPRGQLVLDYVREPQAAVTRTKAGAA